MAKSKGRAGFGRGSSGSGRRGGTVTVIEDQVSRSYARTAKIAFWVICSVVGVLAATVASSYTHPIIALVAGALIGAGVALPISLLICIWPVLRVIWWWLPEITIAAGLICGFMLLSQYTPLYVRLLVVLTLAAPAASAKVRATVMKLVYCFVSRHRIRTCFAEFIVGNNRASLPFILAAAPTHVGESVWIWLRPGLALSDLNNRLDQIAVACWADKVTIERASATNSAYLRIDITRRDALTGTVASPLTEEIDTTVPTQVDIDDTPAAVAGLDIDDVAEEQITDAPRGTARNDTARNDTVRANGAGTKKPATVSATSGDDISDWI